MKKRLLVAAGLLICGTSFATLTNRFATLSDDFASEQEVSVSVPLETLLYEKICLLKEDFFLKLKALDGFKGKHSDYTREFYDVLQNLCSVFSKPESSLFTDRHSKEYENLKLALLESFNAIVNEFDLYLGICGHDFWDLVFNSCNDLYSEIHGLKMKINRRNKNYRAFYQHLKDLERLIELFYDLSRDICFHHDIAVDDANHGDLGKWYKEHFLAVKQSKSGKKRVKHRMRSRTF